MTDYFIGADIGTSSSKALAFSINGRVMGQHQITYPTLRPKPAYAEQDPDLIFQAVTEAIREVVKQRKGQQPVCITFSAAMHSLMAVDGKGRPASRLIIWSDGRSQEEADHLKDQKIATDIYRHTGTPIHPMSPLCKLLWWKKENKSSFDKVTRFISIKDYILFRLFGEYLIDYSLASATGLFDHTTLKWYGPALDLTGITEDRLPACVSPLQVLHGLQKDFARRTGLEPATPFVIGASDGCLANLGTGVTSSGELAATIGTSGAIRLFNNRPINDKKQRLFNYLLLEKEFITGGAINNGGVLLDWFRTHFMHATKTRESYTAFLKQAMKAAPGSRGLIFLPYLQGERSPMWDSRARGAFIGIHSEHERMHFMRAVLEGICFSLYDTVNIMDREGSRVNDVYVSGGFTRSPDWVQMLTDLFDKPVKVTSQGDASSIGAVLLGMRAMKVIDSWKQTAPYVKVVKTYRPHKRQTETYRRNFELFAPMYALLRPAMHQIADWQDQEKK